MPWLGRDKTNDPGNPKHRDPYRFITADYFFESISPSAASTKNPTTITYYEHDQFDGAARNPVCSHGRIFRFDDDSLLLVQFMRPRVWRIRFNPENRSGSDFTDFNTRTIVQDTLSQMIETLNRAEKLEWYVEFYEDPSHYLLQSVVKGSGSLSKHVEVQLWIEKSPFRITATRSIGTPSAIGRSPPLYHDAGVPGQGIPVSAGKAIIWQTKEKALHYQENATILSLEKPAAAKYMGFGEQGGQRLFKENTYMNYFNFDNMRYYNIYDNGPEEDAEPLYHSEPYWIEVNAHPGYMSQVATFIDNYSQVCVDLGKTNTSEIRLATRFNGFQCILLAGDDIGEVIRLYTSIIGRPNLKPRFILGAHQGCYGYDSQKRVEEVVQKYRKYDIPLDGMHIDVDIQRDYRTFTIDTTRFERPEEMFSNLRKKGVRCSTNITPVVSCRPDPEYATLKSGLEGNHFVLDRRDRDPSAHSPDQQRYLQYEKGDFYFTDPARSERPYHDPYNFAENFDKGVPFHGGVDYGNGQGTPGFYPNLNNEKTRAWWGKQHEYLFNTGLEFVWQDMTSPNLSHVYGDMKSWPFRLLLDSDGWSGDPKASETKKAIEIWSLYSYNLHKATFNGISDLACRKGKRNFIIGRGSFAGAQRFAGLWTGDNASTWEFLTISVAQVIALGLGGVTIAGADVGGFEPALGETHFADPELLVRWYCAYSLLPWFRNHYSGVHSRDPKEPKKWFQEPYAYQEYYEKNKDRMTGEEKRIYQSVLPICRYFVRLRYTLLQLLYDAMFESMVTGLPIARAMVITDPMDGSLFSRNEWFSSSQYLVRHDLLVAPELRREKSHQTRKIYLPITNSWYPMNLRPDQDIGEALESKATGGSYINYDCHISSDASKIPFMTPMYIREGAIIPQIEARQFVPDRTRSELSDEPANPISINVYPGRENGEGTKYCMYLDDGVSRSSAPECSYLSSLPKHSKGPAAAQLNAAYGDPAARSNFRHVDIKQVIAPGRTENVGCLRTISITTSWKGPPADSDLPSSERYDDSKVKRDIGPEYRFVVWHDPNVKAEEIAIRVSGTDRARTDTIIEKNASLIWIPVDADVSATIHVTEGGV